MKRIYIFFLFLVFTFPLHSQNAMITVVTPNGGENWTIGCPYVIQWLTATSMPVKIELYKNGAFCLTICSQAPAGMNNYTWIPPYNLTPANTYKVKITALTSSAGYDFSNANFTISLGSIIVTSPNGGEVWQKGSTHQILWTDNVCENVRIDLWKGGVFNSLITASTPSTGSYTWAIPNANTLVPGNDYKVKVMVSYNSGTTTSVYDFSDANFTINQGPYIIVTSPNGGEVWVRGTTHIVTWLDNIPQNIRIELWKGGIFNSLINAQTPSNGSCFWAIPATTLAGNDYKVKVMAINNTATNTLFDLSDNNFTILASNIINNSLKSASAEVSGNDIKIYPNPCADLLHVDLSGDAYSPGSIEIRDMTGKAVLNQDIPDGIFSTIDIPTASLGEGYYILIIRKDHAIAFKKGLVIRH
jgi:hypothetical protein